MLVIIDNGTGNIQSVSHALIKLNVEHIVSNNREIIKNASSIIFPGVGAYPQAMANLKESLLDQLLITKLIEKKTPYLGICLGMQLLFEESCEQTITEGLGLFSGKVERITANTSCSVPHVGWNTINEIRENPLLKNIKSDARFYYDHSFFVSKTDQNVFGQLHYGQEMTVGVWKENIFGVQFHPEKSQRSGLKVLKNFIEYSAG